MCLRFRKATIGLVLLAMFIPREVQTFNYTKLQGDENSPYIYVSVGPSGVWAVNSKNVMFYRTGTYENNGAIGTTWQRKAGNVKQVDVGTDMVCYVSNWGNELFWIPDISKSNPTGYGPTSWEWHTTYIALSSRPDTRYSQLIDVYSQVLNYDGPHNVYSWLGKLRYWYYQHTTASTITNGGAGIWATRGGRLLYKTNTFGDRNTGGSDWMEVDPGPFQHVTSGSGVVLAVRNSGELVQRTGATCSNPTGSGWKLLLPNMSRVDSYGAVAWAVDANGYLYFIEL